MAERNPHCQKCKKSCGKLKKCTGCFSAYYCSRECQRIDWQDHKKACVKVKSSTDKKVDNEKRQESKIYNSDIDICAFCEISKEGEKKKVSNSEIMSEFTENESKSNEKEYKSSSFGKKVNNTVPPRENIGTRRYIMEAVMDEDYRYSLRERDCEVAIEHHCLNCKVFGARKFCSKCKTAFYCNESCQRADWSRHKSFCGRVYTDEEKRVIEERQRMKKAHHSKMFPTESSVYTDKTQINYSYQAGGMDRFYAMLTPEQAIITESRPPGSLIKAVKMASILYPRHDIITVFAKVPWEPLFPWDATFMMERPPSVLVVFMFRYHEHVMRHGVHIKDADDTETKVEFYLDHVGDNPFPFFTYSMVKPGSYICIEDPLFHAFKDGTFGIKIQEPRLVKILKNDSIK